MKKTIFEHSNSFWKLWLLIAILFLSSVSTPFAQRPSPSLGIGFQAGNPTGLSLQWYKNHGITTDILLAYDLDRFYFVNIHGLWNVHLDQGQHFHFYYGPGAFAGVRRHEFDARKDVVAMGLSGNLGLGLVFSRVEFFGQFTPRLELLKTTHFTPGGGLGIRFFL